MAHPTSILPRRRTALALFAATVLAACGGGGGDPPGPSPALATTSGAPAPSAGALPGSSAAGSTTATAAVAPCSLAELDSASIAALNALRAQAQSCGSGGSYAAAAALRWSARLYDAAQAHAQDMVALNYFSHTSADGRTLSDRVEAQGYGWTALAENIARGQADLAAVMASWMGSPGHCANIMGASHQEAALACARDGGGRRTWVLVLGRPA